MRSAGQRGSKVRPDPGGGGVAEAVLVQTETPLTRFPRFCRLETQPKMHVSRQLPAWFRAQMPRGVDEGVLGTMETGKDGVTAGRAAGIRSRGDGQRLAGAWGGVPEWEAVPA